MPSKGSNGATLTLFDDATCETLSESVPFFSGCQAGLSLYACGGGPYDYREGDYLVEG